MNILDIIDRIDLDLLKEQTCVVSETIERLIEEKKEYADPENVERCERDIDHLIGLVELLDNLIIGLEEA